MAVAAGNDGGSGSFDLEHHGYQHLPANLLDQVVRSEATAGQR